MSIARSLVLATALTAAASAASAADDDGNFAVKGAGLETCQSYLQAREQQGNAVVLVRSWLNGFVTAYNYRTEKTYDIAPMHGIDRLEAMLARVCGEDPEQPLVQAAVAVSQGLQPARATAKSERVELSHDGAQVSVPRNLLVRGQQRLKALGHYDGPIDGQYGPGTRGALTAYQEANGLDTTGLPDRATLVRLLSDQE